MKLKNYILASVVLVGALFTGCTKEYYEEYPIREVEKIIVEEGAALMFSEQLPIYIEDWEWNPRHTRFEFHIDYPDMTKEVYEEGALLAYMFVQEVDKDGNEFEVQKQLPFSRDFDENDGIDAQGNPINPRVYTERFGLGMSLGKIILYIENSDKEEKGQYLEEHDYKVAIFWQNKK